MVTHENADADGLRRGRSGSVRLHAHPLCPVRQYGPEQRRQLGMMFQQGGLFLAMFQMPNKFFQGDGRVTDFLGNDWNANWGAAQKK